MFEIVSRALNRGESTFISAPVDAGGRRSLVCMGPRTPAEVTFAEYLSERGYDFEFEPPLGRHRPDFLVQPGAGPDVMIEVEEFSGATTIFTAPNPHGAQILLNPWSILAAMKGDLAYTFPVSRATGGKAGPGGYVLSRNGKLTNDHAYISAVLLIHRYDTRSSRTRHGPKNTATGRKTWPTRVSAFAHCSRLARRGMSRNAETGTPSALTHSAGRGRRLFRWTLRFSAAAATGSGPSTARALSSSHPNCLHVSHERAEAIGAKRARQWPNDRLRIWPEDVTEVSLPVRRL